MRSINRRAWFFGLALALIASELFAASHAGPFAARPMKRADIVLVIHAGNLLAVPGEAPLMRQTVIVRGERIEAVRAGFVDPAEVKPGKDGIELIDLSEYFVMPGLFDSHVHMSRATGAYQSGFATQAQPEPADATVNAMLNAQLTLNAGFTAVRDLGSDWSSLFAVRDAIDKRKLLGPTIIASGPSIGVTGGHGSAREGAAVCDGPDACRSLTRQLEKRGADLIKIKITGGFSSNTGLKQHMTREEMAAIATAAHMRGLTVTAHAYRPDAIRDAVEAGIDCIEHGYLADDQGLKAMKRAGVFLVPTLTVAEPPSFVKRFLRGREPVSVILRNEYQAFERAYDLGVKIAFGTDAGVYAHGRNADEFLTMTGLGMSAEDAIRAATVVAAELFAVDGLNGTIEAGGYADIIAVAGNPLDEISSLQNVDWVIKFGQVAKRAGVMQVPVDYSLKHRY